jgi:drug/metabolite transporter (DMT)-like permease
LRRVALATGLALVAFAGNSLLCRAALRNTTIDPASFTSIRLLAGAITLWALSTMRSRDPSVGGTWASALALLAYAVTFSFAYVAVTAGTGALLLFGAVQLTMILAGVASGERITLAITVGWLLAAAGLTILVLPSLSAPPLLQAALMLVAGVAWGVYSLHGRGSSDPLRDNGGNFIRAVPGALIVSLVLWKRFSVDRSGALLAILSGSLASGAGYAFWYAALPGLKAIAAANLQLMVPLLASFGGILLFSEPLTWRLVAATVLQLGGIGLATRYTMASAKHAR